MSEPSWAERVRAVVEDTCREQGVPLRVSDREVIQHVAVLLGSAGVGGRAQARSASTAGDGGRP